MEDIFPKNNEASPKKSPRWPPGAEGRVGRTPGPLGLLPAPPLAYIFPVIQKPLKRWSFVSSVAAPWRKPTEKKRHLRQADSAGKNTSRKGRSSPSLMFERR